MASAKEVVLQQLQSGQYFYEKFTADLSDSEYFKPPAEGANHAAWLLGHVACSEDSLVAQITGGTKRLPEVGMRRVLAALLLFVSANLLLNVF